MPKAKALLVGLTHVDPKRYNDWDGRAGCYGCAKDVENLTRILEARGWEVATLLDANATCDAVMRGLMSLQKEVRAGDSVFFYFSGHGGQMKDVSGDELDKLDETLVCFDGELIDDHLDAVWTSFMPGVELFMLSDSCNSGTNYKNLNTDFPVVAPLLPLSDLAKQGGMMARMLHMGGCRDARTSTGFEEGGAFTTAIVRQIEGGFSGNWRELYERIRLDVSETQDPQLNLYPVNGNTLDHRAPFQPGSGQPSRPVATMPVDAPASVNAGDLSDGEAMLERIDRVLAAREKAAMAGTRGGGIRLVAEGDSWFDFKILPDIIDYLRRDFGYDIENVAKAGACVYEMAYGPDEDSLFDVFGRDPSEMEEVVKKIRTHRPAAVLLSGGGNDFVGPEFILTIHHAAAKKSGMNEGVMKALFAEELEPSFRRMIETYTAAGRSAGLGTLPIFTHGYDHPFPDGRAAVNLLIKKLGPWMGPSFALKGYPLETPADLLKRRAIVAAMMDTHYAMLHRLAADYSNLRIVDLRGLLPNHKEHWHDELHPTRTGFQRVAARFHEAIRRELGDGPRSAPVPLNPGPEPAPVNQAAELVISLPTAALEALLESRKQADLVRTMLVAQDAPVVIELWESLRGAAANDLTEAPALPQALAEAQAVEVERLETEIRESLRFGLAEEMIATRSGATRAAPTYESRREHYRGLFDSCTIRPEKRDTIAWYRQRILRGKARYEALGAELNGIPWVFIGIIHTLECDNSFEKHLHNGDPLSRRTVRVPAGRPEAGNPPFSWEESARDALTMPGKQFHLQTDWSVPAMLFRWEKYNGFGYINRGIETPYLWSFSNHYTRGKYVRDGVFDANAVSRQAGAATLLKDLIQAGHYTPV